jgi:hypothetical protein
MQKEKQRVDITDRKHQKLLEEVRELLLKRNLDKVTGEDQLYGYVSLRKKLAKFAQQNKLNKTYSTELVREAGNQLKDALRGEEIDDPFSPPTEELMEPLYEEISLGLSFHLTSPISDIRFQAEDALNGLEKLRQKNKTQQLFRLRKLQRKLKRFASREQGYGER